MSEAVLKRCRGNTGYWHHCPGCNWPHRLPEGWTFDGNVDKPTFTPSFKHTWRHPRSGEASHCCHYILTAGVLHFCPDCTHALAGQAVPLPPLSDTIKNGDF